MAVVVLTLFRSAIFVFARNSSFNSDQAVFGLMAKHLAEGRAFPLFMYGQNYILAVEAWMAAPVFLLFGASVAALKLPLLAINIAIGLLLVTLFERELGLRPALGLVASLFFILAPPGTASDILAPDGGNVEPFLYVLLLWITRRRPFWFGLTLGIGFLHREFTIYAALAVIAIEILTGGWRSELRRIALLKAFRVAVEVWLVVQFLRQWASAAGPGTSLADMRSPANNLLEVWNRSCFDPRTLPAGLVRLATMHWPRLFGTERLPTYAFGLESSQFQGMAGASLVLGAAMVLLATRIIMRGRADLAWMKQQPFGIYLTLVGALSAGILVVVRCGSVDIMRYDLLSIYGAVGVTAWSLARERRRWIRRVEVAMILVWAAVSVTAHSAIWIEYTSRPPEVGKNLILKHLQARGIRYARSDYWIAYHVTFMSGERIVVAASDFPRIIEYDRTVEAHRSESVVISRMPCGATLPVFDSIYFCPP